MMVKYTIKELIEKDMIIIPDPDMAFMLGDVLGRNFMELGTAGGVYVMIHEPTDVILYVGVSRGLGQRIAKHKGRGNGAGLLRTKITEALGDAEADKQINNEIKVQIILESDENYQEIYENVLIKKYNPVYNIVGKQGGRGTNKGHGAKNIPMNEIKEKYLAGKSTIVLAKEYGASYETINNRLKDAGVPIREIGAQSLELPEQEIKEKYLAGKSTVELGKEYGVSYKTIISRLKDAGVIIHSNVIKRKQLNAHLINTLELAGA